MQCKLSSNVRKLKCNKPPLDGASRAVIALLHVISCSPLYGASITQGQEPGVGYQDIVCRCIVSTNRHAPRPHVRRAAAAVSSTDYVVQVLKSYA